MSSTELTLARETPLPAIPADELERARDYAQAEKAAATRRA
jgi:hypothetical protein